MTDDERKLLGTLFEVGRELHIRPGDRVLVLDGLVVSVHHGEGAVAVRSGSSVPPAEADGDDGEDTGADSEFDGGGRRARHRSRGVPPGPDRLAMRGRLYRIIQDLGGKAYARQIYAGLGSSYSDGKTSYLVRNAMSDLVRLGAVRIGGLTGSGRAYILLRAFDPAGLLAMADKAIAHLERIAEAENEGAAADDAPARGSSAAQPAVAAAAPV